MSAIGRTHMTSLPIAIALAAALAAATSTAAATSPDSTATEEHYREAAAVHGQALVAIDAGEWERAVRALTVLEALLPDNLLPPLNLAISHLEAGDLEAAGAALDRAAALDPNHPSLLHLRARLERELGRPWTAAIETFAAAHPRDPRPYYLASRWHTEDGDPQAAAAAARRAAAADPENLVLLVDRLVTAAAVAGPDMADDLYAIEDRLDGFDEEAAPWAEAILDAAAPEGDPAAAAPAAQVLRNLLRPGELYRQHLRPLVGRGEVGRGFFLQLDFVPPLPASIQGGSDISFGWSLGNRWPVELSGRPLTIVRGGDILLAVVGGRVEEMRWSEEGWQRGTGSSIGALEIDAGVDVRVWSGLDFDQDRSSDRIVDHSGSLWWLSGRTGAQVELTAVSGDVGLVAPVDLDHDGDLDLVVSDEARSHYLRNNADGTWEADAWKDGTGLPGGLTGILTDFESADFDDDGDSDAVAVTADGLSYLENVRRGLFEASAIPLDDPAGVAGLEVSDFDNDGLFDLLAWGSSGASLVRRTTGGFEIVEIAETPWHEAEVADFDNDGDPDIAVLTAGSFHFARNLGGSFEIEEVAALDNRVEHLSAGDWDEDGDLDLVASAADGLALWRNEGGNLNHWLRLSLTGRVENNAKNHSQGYGSRVEVRSGGRYQHLRSEGRILHIGLGASRQADLLRVLWTNGLAQSWSALAADQILNEEQVLKGSCPFLYAWNGSRFEFVTDLLWKSPLGMTFPDGSAAPHQSGRDFVRIPPTALETVGGDYWMIVTEELWEAVYLDRQELWVYDAPAEVGFVVDESFSLPPHPAAPSVSWLGELRPPTAARDHSGRDVTRRLTARDGRHVGGLPLGRYQGVAAPHTLELEFDRVSRRGDGDLQLVLWGWIFPTDTSINVALSQQRTPAAPLTRLEYRHFGGDWAEVTGGFRIPAGKRKAVVVDLPPGLGDAPFELRLTTNFQIYWDAAAVAERRTIDARLTRLRPRDARLSYRGFSRLYRDDAFGPHLFDADRVTTEVRFRDLIGSYTSYGAVSPLLAGNDDRLVVMNAGDALTVRYPATELPPLPDGWSRHFVLHTDGWVKDGDLNTAASQTVGPMPYHAMTAYPPARTVAHPPAPGRAVDDRPFAEALRCSGTPD